jgi:hypothetical protein
MNLSIIAKPVCLLHDSHTVLSLHSEMSAVVYVHTYDTFWGLTYLHGVRQRLWTATTNGHVVHAPDDKSLEGDGGMMMTGENRRTRELTCPSVTLFITNPTGIDPGANPVLRDVRPATDRLSHSTAIFGAWSNRSIRSVVCLWDGV